jgi:hypothetical protein
VLARLMLPSRRNRLEHLLLDHLDRT